MPNLVQQTIINEGNKYATCHFYFESDGNEGEFKNRVILDPYTDFTIPIPVQVGPDGKALPPEITIREVWTSAAWFDIILGFESTNPMQYVTLARDADFYMDFRSFGGIRDRTPTDLVPTGRLIMTTRDFAPVGSSGFMVLEIRKN